MHTNTYLTVTSRERFWTNARDVSQYVNARGVI